MGTKTTPDCKFRVITKSLLTHSHEDAETMAAHSDVLRALRTIRFPHPEMREPAYSAVRELQRRPAKVVAVIRDYYDKTLEHQYATRWSLVYLLRELGHEASLTMLTRIVDTPIPHEQSPHPEKYSTEAQEIMIRLPAIDALQKLALDGNADAAETLLRQVKHSHFSVRRVAAQAYLQCGGPNARRILERVLPKEEHFVLDLKRGNLQDVLLPTPTPTSEVPEQPLPPPAA